MRVSRWKAVTMDSLHIRDVDQSYNFLGRTCRFCLLFSVLTIATSNSQV